MLFRSAMLYGSPSANPSTVNPRNGISASQSRPSKHYQAERSSSATHLRPSPLAQLLGQLDCTAKLTNRVDHLIFLRCELKRSERRCYYGGARVDLGELSTVMTALYLKQWNLHINVMWGRSFERAVTMEQTILHCCDTDNVGTYARDFVPAYSSAFISIFRLTSAVLLHC
jgi:hypothetical protein